MKPMTNMTQMFKAMTIRTQYLKIVSLVIVSISVFMMNTKNMWVFAVSTTLTGIYLSRFFHICSYCCKRWSSIFNFLFVTTLNRAIFFTRTLSGFILDSTCKANSRLLINYFSIFFVAYLRAVLGCIYARVNYAKLFLTYNTRNQSLCERTFSRACNTAVFCRIFSIIIYSKFALAIRTFFVNRLFFTQSFVSRHKLTNTLSRTKSRPIFLVFPCCVVNGTVLTFEDNVFAHNII